MLLSKYNYFHLKGLDNKNFQFHKRTQQSEENPDIKSSNLQFLLEMGPSIQK